MRAVLIAWTAPTLKHFFACDLQRDFGDHSDGETPVPIPNTAVKPVSADGTGLATVWKSRSSPRSFLLPEKRRACLASSHRHWVSRHHRSGTAAMLTPDRHRAMPTAGCGVVD